MNLLSRDDVFYLCSFLDTESVISFLSISTQFDVIKLKIRINTLVCNSKIKNLRYYDIFSNVCADNTYIFPKYVTHITFDKKLKFTRDFLTKKVKIPESVSSLTINQFGYINRLIIPKSVTHLYFSGSYGKSFPSISKGELKKINSDDIKRRDDNAMHKCYKCGHYKICYFDVCNNIVEDCIPDGITHLFFGDQFTQPFYDRIPVSVTHISISRKYFIGSPPTLPQISHLTIRSENKDIERLIKFIKTEYKFIENFEIEIID
uniref:F-box domain-containing protein n=1 Tax=viral metagenome TaxID=1070528 RepID=A0A6C0CBD5_9ZZZZ